MSGTTSFVVYVGSQPRIGNSYNNAMLCVIGFLLGQIELRVDVSSWLCGTHQEVTQNSMLACGYYFKIGYKKQ